MPIGIICNVLAVALGGVIGAVGGKKLSEEFKQKLNLIFSICAMGIGISSTVLMQSMPAVILSLILGTIVGIVTHLGRHIENGSRKLAKLIPGQGDNVTIEVVAEREPSAPPEKVEAALAALRGDIFQTEPRFCSVRREGSAAYEIADTGEHSQFLAHVYRFRAAPADGGRMSFEVEGTKSLLVRTLVNDFGAELGCGACLESLRRVRVGKFDVADAIPFDRLLETEMGGFASCVKPVSAFLR